MPVTTPNETTSEEPTTTTATGTAITTAITTTGSPDPEERTVSIAHATTIDVASDARDSLDAIDHDRSTVQSLHERGIATLTRALLRPALAASAGDPVPVDALSSRARWIGLARVQCTLGEDELRTLAQHDPDADLRATALSVIAARAIDLGDGVLRALVVDPDYKVRLEVLRADHLPSWAIVRLALDTDPLVRSTAIAHRATTAEIIVELLHAVVTPEQAAAVCRSEHLDLDLVAASLSGSDAAVRDAVAHALLARPVLPLRLLEHFLLDLHGETVRATAVRHPSLPTALVRAQATSPSALVRVAVAESPAADAATLQSLHDDPVVDVRLAVASHGDTATATLLTLAQDPELVVRQRVLNHPRVTPAALRLLAADTDADLRLRALQHARCPERALVAAASDDDVQIRRTLAALEHCPAAALRLLLTDGDALVRRCAASNPAAPVEALDLAARRDRSPVVQRAAVRNPSCSAFTAAWARTQHHLLLPALRHEVPANELFAVLRALDEHHMARDQQTRRLRRAVLDHRAGRTRRRDVAQRRRDQQWVGEQVGEVRARILERIAAQRSSWLRRRPELLGLSDDDLRVVVRPHLRAVAEDPRDRVRRIALETRSITAKALRCYVADPVDAHRALVAANPATDHASLVALAADPCPAVRAAVAMHPRVDRTLLLRFAADPVDAVRTAATRRLLEAL